MTNVRDVMRSDLVAVPPSTTVQEAARAMVHGHVGSALVMDGDRLVGIFTERDIMRAMAQGAADAARVSHVDHWMTQDPVTVGPDAPVGEALDMMLFRGFRHLVVVEGEKVAGVVSMRDLSGRVS